jgi:hydroxymethyl cephem carbamoyltransferase
MLAARIDDGAVVAWGSGKYEIGPRALGHRSLLASPLLASSKDALNAIKQREDYRPIAPVALWEDVRDLYKAPVFDPYMLYFSRVDVDDLPGVTHVDGTARIQTVTEGDESSLHGILSAFKRRTGFGVLCNTSLNYPGRGFINSMTDLIDYAEKRGIREVVVEDTWYRR